VLAGTLLVAGALLQAAGVILIPAWVRDVLRAQASLGVVGGAALVGMLLARAARAPSGGPDAGGGGLAQGGSALALAAGYLLVGAPAAVGYGHGGHRLPDILLTGALAAGSAAFGLALGATAPGTAALADPLLSADRRARVAGLVAGLALLAVPAGGLAGGWLAGRVGFTAAVAWGAGLASLAVLAPLAGYRAWRHADRLDRSAIPAGTGEVVSVTVGYADGEWTVEIDSGRRRLIRSAMLAASAAFLGNFGSRASAAPPKESGLSFEGLLKGEPGFQPRKPAPLPLESIPGFLSREQLARNYSVYRDAFSKLLAAEDALKTAPRDAAHASEYATLRTQQVVAANADTDESHVHAVAGRGLGERRGRSQRHGRIFQKTAAGSGIVGHVASSRHRNACHVKKSGDIRKKSADIRKKSGDIAGYPWEPFPRQRAAAVSPRFFTAP